MAEPAETPKLSGLARSIDALFAPAPVAGQASSASPPPITQAPPPIPDISEHTEAERTPSEVEAADTAVAPPPLPAVQPPPLPTMPEMFPASQMMDAITAVPWADGEPEPASFELAPSNVDPVPMSAEMEPVLEVAGLADLDLVDEVSVVPELPAAAPVPVEAAPLQAERSDADPISFRHAVEAYVAGEQGAGEKVEALAAALRDRLALDPLADAVESLVREAGDPPDPRFLELAGSVINPAVASRIVQRMGQNPEGARREEYFALCRRMGLPMANALKGALTGALDREVRRVHHDALISMGEVSRPGIEGMVQDDNRFLVRDGVAILGEIGGPRAVELVTSALADTDARVRSEALLALGNLGDEKAGQLVLASLEDADPAVRLAAAIASGQLGLERALRPLIQMLEKEHDPERCISLLQALGAIGDPGAVHAIEKHAVPSLFSKPRTDVRVAAYRALHAIGTPHARDLIKQTAHDKDPVVRVALKDLARAD